MPSSTGSDRGDLAGLRAVEGRGRPPPAPSCADGQASVEMALLLPLVVVLLLGLLQVALVGRDQLALELAAREAARAAAVSADPAGAARAAAERVIALDPLTVLVAVGGSSVTVTVGHRNRTDVPLAGRLIPDVELRARATMALEPP